MTLFKKNLIGVWNEGLNVGGFGPSNVCKGINLLTHYLSLGPLYIITCQISIVYHPTFPIILTLLNHSNLNPKHCHWFSHLTVCVFALLFCLQSLRINDVVVRRLEQDKWRCKWSCKCLGLLCCGSLWSPKEFVWPTGFDLDTMMMMLPRNLHLVYLHLYTYFAIYVALVSYIWLKAMWHQFIKVG